MLKKWLDFFKDDIKAVATRNQMALLQAYAAGDKPLPMDEDDYPRHYSDIGNNFIEETVDDGERYVRNFTRRLRDMQREFVQADRSRRG